MNHDDDDDDDGGGDGDGDGVWCWCWCWCWCCCCICEVRAIKKKLGNVWVTVCFSVIQCVRSFVCVCVCVCVFDSGVYITILYYIERVCDAPCAAFVILVTTRI